MFERFVVYFEKTERELKRTLMILLHQNKKKRESGGKMSRPKYLLFIMKR